MVGLLFVCMAFAAGFLLRGNEAFLDRLGFDTPANNQDSNPGMTVSGDTHESVSARVAEVQGILEKDSVNEYDLDTTTEAVIDSFLASTGDPFVSYLDQNQYQAYLMAAADSYTGVGVLFSERDGHACAIDVFSGSEAEAKGVRPDDFVVAIDGNRNSGAWTQAEVVRTLGNLENETVVITWRRGSSGDEGTAEGEGEGSEEFATELKVSDYHEPNVEVRLIDKEVGYIKLSQVSSNSDDLVKEALENLKKQGATCYILDLRDNPGGYITQAIDIGSLFVSSGTFVKISVNGNSLDREVSSNLASDGAPLVVLVNGHTAAAAEVIAGGLQDLGNEGKVRVVGETTMGKGSVQTVSALSFGGGIRYTTAYYQTPNGYDINGNGIVPDIQVAEGSSSEDAQLSVAVDAAKTMVSAAE